MKEEYLLNIKTHKIHSATHPCPRVAKMAEASKKVFDEYDAAVNYFTGKTRKGEPCAICFPEKQ